MGSQPGPAIWRGRCLTSVAPGWTQQAQPLEEFSDERELQRRMKAAGLELVMEADESTTGPASLMLSDPDGNMILFDQHVE